MIPVYFISGSVCGIGSDGSVEWNEPAVVGHSRRGHEVHDYIDFLLHEPGGDGSVERTHKQNPHIITTTGLESRTGANYK